MAPGANRKIQIRPKEKVERWNPDHNLSRNRFSVSVSSFGLFREFCSADFLFLPTLGTDRLEASTVTVTRDCDCELRSRHICADLDSLYVTTPTTKPLLLSLY
jgi:hypothetical protein